MRQRPKMGENSGRCSGEKRGGNFGNALTGSNGMTNSAMDVSTLIPSPKNGDGEMAASKEQIEQEMQLVSRRNGFKLVDFHGGREPKNGNGNSEKQEIRPSCPIRFEGKGLLGKKIVVHVPKRYCADGELTLKSRERLAAEGFCSFAERSKELYECQMVFKANDSDQWKIEIVD